MMRLLLALILAAAAAFAGGITGQVVDAETGDPIAGAVVVAKSASDAGRALTNERGVYRIADLDPGRYNVAAKARGYLLSRYPRTVPVRANEMTDGIDFRLTGKRSGHGAISGRVVDRRTDEPIRGATIVAVGGGARYKASTDGRGRYLLRGLKPGRYSVTAGARGYVKESYPRPVPVVAGRVTKDIDFALASRQRPGAITGRVVDARTREPIAGAVVVARGEHGNGRALTDRRGHYVLKLKPGSYQVAARARGYVPETYPRPVPVEPGSVTKDINFALRHSQAGLAD